jgi:hypothetical protein
MECYGRIHHAGKKIPQTGARTRKDGRIGTLLQIWPDVQISLCKGYSSKLSVEKARAYGIDGFNQKPAARKGFAVLSRNVLDRGSKWDNSMGICYLRLPDQISS